MRRLFSTILLLAFALTFSACGTSDTPDITDSADTTAVSTETTGSDTPEVEAEVAGYAADTLFADGKVLTESTGDLTVAFVGGAVSEGQIRYDVYQNVYCGYLGNEYDKNEFADEMLYYFRKKFPSRRIRAYNIAKKGNGSAFAAATYGGTVLKYSPDIIFLEFANSDMGRSEEEVTASLESIVAQAQACEKVPVLVMVISAPPVTENDAEYASWLAAKNIEVAFAEKYGIMTIDMYDAIKDSFESSGSEDFAAWRSEHFSGIMPVKKFYLYSDTVKAAIEADPAAFYSKLPEGNGITSSIMTPKDSRITYEGEWTEYTFFHQFDVSSVENGELMSVPYWEFFYPYFYDGMKATLNSGSAFSFESSADSFTILTHSCMRGAVANVYVDGELWGNINSNSNERKRSAANGKLNSDKVKNVIDDCDNGIVNVKLPGDGNTHTVRIAADDISGTHLTFRFAYIIEQTAAK